MIKKIFLSVLFCTVSMLGMAQSQTITHVVQRGETLESIAEYYKVSVEDINKANPNTDGMVYVGMKLVVPVGSTTNSTTKTTVLQEKDNAVSTAVTTVSNRPKLENESRTIQATTYNRNPWKIKAVVGLTSSSWTGKDFKNENIGIDDGEANVKTKTLSQFHIGLIADYVLSDNIYAGLGMVFNQSGYEKTYTMTSGQYWVDEGANYDGETTEKMTVNRFDIPVHIGGICNISSNTKLFIEAGPYISWAISGNNRRSGYYTEYPDTHSSETEHIDQKEKIGKGALKDYQKFGYGLSATAGISFNKTTLQFTYQRGLNKTIKKTEQYEQNLLFSLGYDF